MGLMIDGNWVEDPQAIKTEVQNYFEQCFTNSLGTLVRLDGISFKSISDADNELLTGRFGMEEVKGAVWECGGDKSPGPDEFNFKFIQKFWDLLKDDFHRVLEDFWNRGCGLKDVTVR